MAGKPVNTGCERFVRRSTSNGLCRQNEYQETGDKQQQSYPEPGCPYLKWQKDRVEGRDDPESVGEKRHNPILPWNIARPLADMSGDYEYCQPLQGENNHEPPGIPQTYLKSWYEGHGPSPFHNIPEVNIYTAD